MRRALSHTLRVPPAATPRQVRVDGLIASAVGLVVVLAGTLGAMLLERYGPTQGLTVGFGRVMLALVFVGYGFLIIGGYRAVTGRHPASEHHDSLSSLRRIVTGVVVVIIAFALFYGLLLLVGLVMGWK
ncbi:MAG: hypothetical protein HY906_12165 [Deltaproteobacteria bacterium]|nr:hypothetical protein [Deltaproteobacteria bacterium]